MTSFNSYHDYASQKIVLVWLVTYALTAISITTYVFVHAIFNKSIIQMLLKPNACVLTQTCKICTFQTMRDNVQFFQCTCAASNAIVFIFWIKVVLTIYLYAAIFAVIFSIWRRSTVIVTIF